MRTLYMKRNESITLLVTFTDDDNELMEVSVEDIKAQIRNNYNDFVAEFTVSQNEDLTSYTLECFDTKDFPLGELFFDIALKMDNGSFKYSETMKIVVLEERTRNTNEHGNLEEIEITENGEYTPSQGYIGFNKVIVNVLEKQLETKNITENGEYLPSEGYDGFSEVNVNVQPNLEDIEITENGEYTASEGYDGFGQVNVSVDDSIKITTSYVNGIISWDVDSEYSDLYSNVFVNGMNIYNGIQKSCQINNTFVGLNNIKISVFDKTKLKTGYTMFEENIQQSLLKIELENGQAVSSLKFDDIETEYYDNMEIPSDVNSIKIVVSKTDETYNSENRSQIIYRNFEYTFEQDIIGLSYIIKPYNLPILSISDRVSATECQSSDMKFNAKTDSEWGENEGSTYKLFDMNNGTFWNTLRTNFPHWIDIYTENKICLKSLSLHARGSFYTSEFPKQLLIQGSNDGENYIDITNLLVEYQPSNENDEIKLLIDNNNFYNYYKINIYSTFSATSSQTAATSISELSFIALRE